MGQLAENPNLEIDWSQYSDHGFSQLLDRGVSKKLAESIVANGKPLVQAGGRKFAFVTPEGVIVLASDGKIVTGWSALDFDEAMLEIIKKLFGDV